MVSQAQRTSGEGALTPAIQGAALAAQEQEPDADVFFTEDDIVTAAAKSEQEPDRMFGESTGEEQSDEGKGATQKADAGQPVASEQRFIDEQVPTAINAFEDLLASAGVHAFSRWERELGKIQNDPRFQVFSGWRVDGVHQESSSAHL